MRLLKFISVIIGTLLLVFLLSFGFNLDALFTTFENQEDLQEGQEWIPRTNSLQGLTAYIRQHPGRVSLASHSTENPDTSLLYTADMPRTMGTLSNFFLLTTYARLVETGDLQPEELVPWAEVERYQLPFIDASNHDQALNALEEQDLFASQREVPLKNLVQVALQYNDLAISDYLLFRFGMNRLRETFQLLELDNTDLPLPFSGLYIAAHPMLDDRPFKDHFTRLQNLSDEDFRQKVIGFSRRYANDSTFYQNVTSIFTDQKGLGIKFSEQRDILSLFPKSTAGELARLMKQVQENSLISPDVSARMQQFLSWPYEQQGLSGDFVKYGGIFDNRIGLLNGIDYGTSVNSGEPFVQAVFFDSLQIAFWLHMSSNQILQDYQQRLIWDPALREVTLQQISNSTIH